MAWSPVRRANAGCFEVDHPGDYATLTSNHIRDGTAIRIVTDKGETVAGTASPLPDAPAWQFIPDHDWLPGRYRIEVRTEVEDVSGNSVQSTFDAIAGQSASLRDEQLLLSFEIGGS